MACDVLQRCTSGSPRRRRRCEVPQRSQFGPMIVLAGVVLVIIGALAWLGALSWFGRLPGDVRVERPGVRFYAPITSMVIVSLLLSAVVALVRRYWS